MPKYGGQMPGNMNSIMKQAQQMQRRVAELQSELGERTLEVTSGGGAIKILISGNKDIKEITVSPEVVDPDEVEMLQDLLLAAIREAMRQADEMVNAEMAKITGGMNIPGLF